MVVDVRSAPHSRFNPQFNQRAIEQTLIENGINYEIMGNKLGGRPKDPTCYRNGMPDERLLARQTFYMEGINRLMGIASKSKTAIMCAEEDPNYCHRRHIMSKTLVRMRITVRHIRGDGSIEIEPRSATIDDFIGCTRKAQLQLMKRYTRKKGPKGIN